MKRLRILLSFIAAGLLAGSTACGSPGIPLPPSLDLPEPPTDLHAVRKGGRVYLAWTVPTETTDGQAALHIGETHVCRSLDIRLTDCTQAIGEIPPPPPSVRVPQHADAAPIARADAIFKDDLPPAIQSGNPDARLFYAVSIANTHGKSAGISNVISVPTFTSPHPPGDFQATLTREGVVLAWTGTAPDTPKPTVDQAYRLYRHQQDTNTDVAIGEVPMAAGNEQLTDNSFQWEKTYDYRIVVVTRIHQKDEPDLSFESDDSPSSPIFAHDVFPPAVPSGLQAVYSEVGQHGFVDLVWAPVTDTDLAGYNIYRREGNAPFIKLNSEFVKPSAFRDTSVSPGHDYSYAVTAVDVRGNESAKSTEAGEHVPQD